MIASPDVMTDVVLGCIRALTKLTKIPKGTDEFLSLGGIPSIVKAMGGLTVTELMERPDVGAALTSGVKLLTRVGKNQDVLKSIGECNGMDMCLKIIELSTDAQVR